MTRIVIFGAGGRAGRRAVAEAASRGHAVTAVVRDGAGRDVGQDGVTVVAGDVTDAGSVAAVAAGHDVAVTAAARLDVPAIDFYTAATSALVAGLGAAGVGRLVLVGMGPVLEVAPGRRLLDEPGFPPEHRAFALGHVAQLGVLAAAGPSGPDWVVLAPPVVFLDDAAARTGHYRTGGPALLQPPDAPFSYADLAVALVDEADSPRHHRELVAVGAHDLADRQTALST